MLTPAHNRMSGKASAALASLTRLQGESLVRIGGVQVSAFVGRDESTRDPIAGGMLDGGQRTVMVAKGVYPNRPADNVAVVLEDGAQLVAIEVTDRAGYWHILAGAELA